MARKPAAPASPPPPPPLNAKPPKRTGRTIDKTKTYLLFAGIASVLLAVAFTVANRGPNQTAVQAPDAQKSAPAMPSLSPVAAEPKTYDQLPPPPPPPVLAQTTTDATPAGAPILSAEQRSILQQQAQKAEREAAARAAAAASPILIDDEEGGKKGGAVGAISQAVAGSVAPQIPDIKLPAAPEAANQGGLSEHLQDQKKKFADDTTGVVKTYVDDTLHAPLSQYEVKAGWVIHAALMTAINSDIPGDVFARVTENVYDSRTGRHLLIPQQAVLQGRLNSVVAPGQTRVQAGFVRLILPNAKSVSLGGMNGVDPQGRSGFPADVDNHLDQLATGIGLASVVSFLGNLASNAGTNNSNKVSITSTAGQSAAQTASQVGDQFVSRELNIQPTLTKEIGEPIIVMVNKDLILEPYVQE